MIAGPGDVAICDECVSLSTDIIQEADGVATPLGTIELRGLRVLGTHGVLEEEQARPQPFEVDLDVHVALDKAGTTDDLADTVDYAHLAGLVSGVIGGEHHELLERLAERIADSVLTYPQVRTVVVAVRKLRPPVPYDLASAGVRLTRHR